MASRFGYEYGMGRPTMGQPPTIADHMAQRQQYEYGQQRLYEANQAAAFQQRNDLARQQAMDEQKIETDLRRNRLGLGGLDAALADPYSILHERQYDSGQVDRDGNPMYMNTQELGIPEVQIEMGDVRNTFTNPATGNPAVRGQFSPEQVQGAEVSGGKAFFEPKPIGLSPLNRMSGRQVVRDEFADAKAALRPKDAVSSNRMTTQEYIDRLKAKQIADGETDDRRTQNDLSLKMTDAEMESLMAAANIEAKDLAADKPGVADKLRKAVADYVAKKQGSNQKLDLGGGAVDGTAAPVKPSATEANGELKVEVAPAVDVDPAEVAKYKKLYPQLTEQQIINGLRNNKKTNG